MLSKKSSIVCAAVAGTLMLGAYPVQASQFMNITFDGDTVGSAPAVGASGSPITKIGALGGYTATAYNSPPTTDNGTILVGNVAGMSKAAVLTTNSANGEVGALFMDTAAGQVSSQLSITFDISVLAAPTAATAQAPFTVDNGPDQAGVLFGLRTYNATASQWAFSFAVVPTSEGGGLFALRDGTNTIVNSFGSYVEGQKYNIVLSSDYTLGTVDAYVDGVLGASAYPLRGGASATPVSTSELFIYFNGETGYANEVAIDNIKGYDTVVPEPTTFALLGLGGLLLGRRRR